MRSKTTLYERDRKEISIIPPRTIFLGLSLSRFILLLEGKEFDYVLYGKTTPYIPSNCGILIELTA